MNLWSLVLFDSEGGDYARATSLAHDTEVYLHEYWEIKRYSSSSLDDDQGFNVFLSESPIALPFFC